MAAACGGTGKEAAKDGRPSADSGLGSQESTPSSPKPKTGPKSGSRPNVLVIETDDMRWDELRWMPTVRNVIQKRGITFMNSFAPYPLCCPSRSSFMTGKYTHSHGVLSHENPFGFRVFRDRDTLATRLQESGYQTALVGKYLNGYGQQPLRNGKDSLYYVPPGWTEWYAGSDKLWGPNSPIQGSTYNYYRLVQNINGKIKQFPGEYSTDVLTRQTGNLVRKFGKVEKPWFVWFTPVAPHHGDPVEPDDPRPIRQNNGNDFQFDTPARPDWVKGRFDGLIKRGLGRPPQGQSLTKEEVRKKPRFVKRVPWQNRAEDVGQTKAARQRAESLYALDARLRGLMRTLRKTGQVKNTVVVFTSDNGYYLGEQKLRQGKITAYEPSLRVPLVISGPEIEAGMRFDPATSVDLAPTIADLAGVSLADPDGKSLLPNMRNGDQGWQCPVVTEGMMLGMPYKTKKRTKDFPSALNTRGIRLGQWKFTAYSTGEKELYDLAEDPLEKDNLAANPKYRAKYDELVKVWRSYSKCKGDECRKKLPKDLRLTPEQNQKITENQIKRTADWFANPGLSDEPLPRSVTRPPNGRR